MYYIKDKFTCSSTIKHSEFIAICMPLNDINCVKYILDNIKKEYPKATHYCYAYIKDSYIKFSDDGEPSQTAGKPILNVLQSTKMNDIILVVVRYFGGIKLGASNLLRAYVNSATSCLQKCILYEKKILNKVKLEIDYKYSDILFNYLENNNYIIKEKIFLDKIEVIVLKENFKSNELENYFNGNINIHFYEDENTYVKALKTI